MRVSLKSVILNGMAPVVFAAAGFCQSLPEDLHKQVDAVVQEAYQTASAKFPCELKAGGKPKMLRWQSVDKCLNLAYESVDWENISRRLQAIQAKGRNESADFLSAVEASLSAHAVIYDKVFEVKDDKALLPLSNSVLKFLPADSLLESSGDRQDRQENRHFFRYLYLREDGRNLRDKTAPFSFSIHGCERGNAVLLG